MQGLGRGGESPQPWGCWMGEAVRPFVACMGTYMTNLEGGPPKKPETSTNSCVLSVVATLELLAR